MGEYKVNRLANTSIATLFLVFNIGYFSDAITNQNADWAYILGVAYLLYNILVIEVAWEWTEQFIFPLLFLPRLIYFVSCKGPLISICCWPDDLWMHSILLLLRNNSYSSLLDNLLY